MGEDFVPRSGGVASLLSGFVVPALRKEREGRGTPMVVDSSKIGSPGHPPSEFPLGPRKRLRFSPNSLFASI